MYIRKLHGFLQLLYMYSENCEDRFLFLCCQRVSILIFHQLGFYCRFLLVAFHFGVFFLTVFGFKLFDNIFSILNGDSLLRGISSADSIMMKDGK